MELRQSRQNRKRWEDLVQSVSMGCLCVQYTFSMLLLGDLVYAPRKIMNNEIEFESNTSMPSYIHYAYTYDLATYIH